MRRRCRRRRHASPASRLLAGKREKIEGVLRQFREVPEHGGNWGHVVSHNIAHLEADLAWLDSVLSELHEAQN